MTAPGLAAHPAGTVSGPELGIAQALRLIAEHERSAARTLTMIPSENMLPPLARLPLLSDLYCRYFFNDSEDPGDWRFPAARDAAALETQLTIPLLQRLSSAAHVNVRPISGLNAMTLVLAALAGPPGSPVAVVSPRQGGHYATASLATRLGLHPLLLTGPNPHTVDLQLLSRLLDQHQPRLLYLDQSHGLVPFDITAITRVARQASPATRVHADISHWMGLILGGALPSPLTAGADSFGGSTHKTFPGPQKGIIATSDPEIAQLLRATQPHVISSHHYGATCALGLALAMFTDRCPAYPRTIVANARALGAHLAERGLPPEGAAFGYSHGHQLWIRTTPHGIGAADTAGRLHAAGIRVNFLTDLPGIDEPALRLGVNEATWLGMTPSHAAELADIIAAAIFATHPASGLAARTAALRRSLTVGTCPPGLRNLTQQIIQAVFGEAGTGSPAATP